MQRQRLDRAVHEDISVAGIDALKDSVVFTVVGLTDVYDVEISQYESLWPPTCTCEDYFYRPDLRCKHVTLCLKLCGVREEDLADALWQAAQDDIYDILTNAPDVDLRVHSETFDLEGDKQTDPNLR